MTATSAEPHLLSPCVGTCELEPRSGWCQGCGRSGDEIAGWGSLPQVKRDAVWPLLPARLAAIGTPFRLLPWTPEVVALRLARELDGRTGAWWTALGSLQQTAEASVAADGARLILSAAHGRLELVAAPGLRAFVIGDRHLTFCLHRSRVPASAATLLVPTPLARLQGGSPLAEPPPPLAALPTGYRAYAGFSAATSLAALGAGVSA